MKITTATYIKGSSLISQCPPADRPEYAFIGRSNVGKSSLINMITSVGNLAKTSQTPGKTQIINHYLINEKWYLVDLPGYGYAKVSKTERVKFEQMIGNYLFERSNLINIFVLIDSRHPPQKVDTDFMEKLGTNGLPFSIIFTKADKISNTQLTKNLEEYTNKMLETWAEMPQYFISSSESRMGREEILQYIDSLHSIFSVK